MSERRYSYVETARGDLRLVRSTEDGLSADVCYVQQTGIQRLLVTDELVAPLNHWRSSSSRRRPSQNL